MIFVQVGTRRRAKSYPPRHQGRQVEIRRTWLVIASWPKKKARHLPTLSDFQRHVYDSVSPSPRCLRLCPRLLATSWVAQSFQNVLKTLRDLDGSGTVGNVGGDVGWTLCDFGSDVSRCGSYTRRTRVEIPKVVNVSSTLRM